MVATCQEKSEIKVIWQPQPGSQELFLSCPIFECLYEGTRGPGKTDALLMDFAQFVGRGFGPEWIGILFREEYPNLEDVINKSKKWFYRIFPGAFYNESQHKWRFPEGEELFFRHAKRASDYWKYHGHGYPWIGWEELTNWPDDKLYLSMMSVCRSSHPGMPRHYRATCNPYGPGHNWVKARFIDPAPRGFVIQDGKDGRERVCIHGEIWENKILLENDPDYIKNLQAQSGEKRKAWLEGDWDIVAGGMFDDVWNKNIHVIEPFTIPETWKLNRSFDWGSSKPYSVGFWAESDGCDIKLEDGSVKSTRRGDLFRVAELYGWNGNPNEGTKELAVEVARKIKQREADFKRKVYAGPADSSIFDVQNGNSIADDMARAGVSWTRADKSPGSRKNGWEIMRKLLKNAITKEGPGLYIFNTSRHFIRTLPTLVRDENNPEDIDTDCEDHCLHGDTEIITSAGIRKISDLVGTEGYVLTAGGYWTPYYDCKMTQKNVPVVKVTFDDDSSVVCTPNHRFLTANFTWQEAKEWKFVKYQKLSKSSWVRRITFAGTISSEKAFDFIERYGNTITGRSPVDSTSITKTVISQIMRLPTLAYCQIVGICNYITKEAIAMKRYFLRPGTPLLNGMGAKREKTGISNNTKNTAKTHSLKHSKRFVDFAERNLKGIGLLSIAPITVSRMPDEKQGVIMSQKYALSAESHLQLINTMEQKHARYAVGANLGVKHVEEIGKADVYCLNADITHCFALANGVMVHNCADEARYRCGIKTYRFSSSEC